MPKGLIRVDGNVAYVTLTKGYVATVDAADVEILAPFSWFVNTSQHLAYGMTRTRDAEGRVKIVFMHTMLLQPPTGLITDHIDGDGLNNRRSNLRAVTPGQNKYNSRTYKNSQSGVKGVMPTKTGTWTAQIRYERRKHYLGTFKTLAEAQQAYADAAKRLHGDYARLD
jgi:hypothetical protein